MDTDYLLYTGMYIKKNRLTHTIMKHTSLFSIDLSYTPISPQSHKVISFFSFSSF
jgi:hypothetical protein